MRVKIITAYDCNYRPLGEARQPNLSNYCAAQQNTHYQRFVLTGPEGRHPSWMKIGRLLHQFRIPQDYDWYIWIDTDVMLLNSQIPIQDVLSLVPKDKPVFFSSDSNGLCAGVMGIRPLEWTNHFLEMIERVGHVDPERLEEFDKTDKWEQNTIKVFERYFPEVRDAFFLMPEHVIQNPDSEYSKNAWMVHFWMGGRDQADVIESIRQIETQGWTHETLEAIRYRQPVLLGNGKSVQGIKHEKDHITVGSTRVSAGVCRSNVGGAR